MYLAIINGTKTQTRRALNKVNEKPRYEVDEIIYVKEPFLLIPGVKIPHYLHDEQPEGLDISQGKKMSPLFMPEKYARTFLQITAVRQELLRHISNDDAIAEGVEVIEKVYPGIPLYKTYKPCYTDPSPSFSPINSFKSLWESINGKYSFQETGYVWVYTFKIHNQF